MNTTTLSHLAHFRNGATEFALRDDGTIAIFVMFGLYPEQDRDGSAIDTAREILKIDGFKQGTQTRVDRDADGESWTRSFEAATFLNTRERCVIQVFDYAAPGQEMPAKAFLSALKALPGLDQGEQAAKEPAAIVGQSESTALSDLLIAWPGENDMRFTDVDGLIYDDGEPTEHAAKCDLCEELFHVEGLSTLPTLLHCQDKGSEQICFWCWSKDCAELFYWWIENAKCNETDYMDHPSNFTKLQVQICTILEQRFGKTEAGALHCGEVLR